jgi:hypothetical protein
MTMVERNNFPVGVEPCSNDIIVGNLPSLARVAVADVDIASLLEEVDESKGFFLDGEVKVAVLSNLSQSSQVLDLVVIKVKQLFPTRGSVGVEDVAEAGQSLGLKLCPSEVGLKLALLIGKGLTEPIVVLTNGQDNTVAVNLDRIGSDVEIALYKGALDPMDEVVFWRPEIGSQERVNLTK